MAAMTTAHPSLTRRLACWPSTPPARRPVPSWAGHPRLGCFATAGEAATAARSDRVLFAVLVSRRDDEISTVAALSVVASRLVPVVDRWARSGVPAAVLEDMDAELVAEVLSVVRDHPGWPAEKVAGWAWQRVSGRRRTERARARRHVTLDERRDPAVAAHTGRVCLTGSAALVALAAVSGWGPAEATTRLGLTPVAWRARTSRARKVVRAELGVR